MAPARLGPVLDLGDRRAQDPLLDRLTLAIQRLELLGELRGLAPVGGEQELEGGLGAPEAARGVDPGCEAEADRRLVAGGRIDSGDLHQRAEPGLLGLREAAQPRECERPALVDERDDVGDRGERDDVEVAVEEGMPVAEQRLGELPDDRGAAQPGERVVALERRDDGAVGELVGGPVVVGDDHVERRAGGPRRPRRPR